MTATVLPYLVAAKGAAAHGGWELRDGETWRGLGDALNDWDYHTDLHIAAVVTVDADAFFASTGLDEDASLRWVVSWRSIDGKLGATALLRDATRTGLDEPVRLEATLRGDELSPIIDLRTRLVLAEAHAAGSPGVATRPGSILWEDVHTVALAGDSARFPVDIVDFSAAGLDPDASWVLDVSDDLSAPVSGGVQLLLNERDHSLVGAVNNDPNGVLALQLVEDVAVEFADHAVRHADDLRAEEWNKGSIGETLSLLTRRADGGIAGLVALREARRGAYRAALVGTARRCGSGRTIR